MQAQNKSETHWHSIKVTENGEFYLNCSHYGSSKLNYYDESFITFCLAPNTQENTSDRG